MVMYVYVLNPNPNSLENVLIVQPILREIDLAR